MISKRTFFISLLVALLGFCFKYFTHVEFSPIVETKSGAIRGFLSKSRLGRDFYQFRGIPYAKPPVGELRFSVSCNNYQCKMSTFSSEFIYTEPTTSRTLGRSFRRFILWTKMHANRWVDQDRGRVRDMSFSEHFLAKGNA